VGLRIKSLTVISTVFPVLAGMLQSEIASGSLAARTEHMRFHMHISIIMPAKQRTVTRSFPKKYYQPTKSVGLLLQYPRRGGLSRAKSNFITYPREGPFPVGGALCKMRQNAKGRLRMQPSRRGKRFQPLSALPQYSQQPFSSGMVVAPQ